MSLATQIADEIAAVLHMNGSVWSLEHEWCSQTFQQAHAIRAMLAGHRIKPRKRYLDVAKAWADTEIRMQGTQGHPDAFNMAYGNKLRAGVPKKWFVADCGTVACALLDLASFLPEKNALRVRIMDSVTRFADYVRNSWTLKDGSVTLGFMEYECLDKVPYHCANGQTNLFLWPLWKMTGDETYLKQALGTTKWLVQWDDYDSLYWGNGTGNRAYNGESLFVSHTHMPESEKKLKAKIEKHLVDKIVSFCAENYGDFWFKNGLPSAPKDPLLFMVLGLIRDRITKQAKVTSTWKKASAGLDKRVRQSLKAVKDHKASGWAIAVTTEPKELFESLTHGKFYTTDGMTGMALAMRENPQSLFPLG
jgi:hypothetical protein